MKKRAPVDPLAEIPAKLVELQRLCDAAGVSISVSISVAPPDVAGKLATSIHTPRPRRRS